MENVITQTQAASASQRTQAVSSSMLAANEVSTGDFEPMLSFSTNSLWLQIGGISNGLAYLSLNNATDQVYEIMWKTDLAATNWNTEPGVVFGTNSGAVPFTIPVLDRTNALFIWAKDWTGVAENGNTVPDWWLWEYFGTLNLSDTNLDSDGNTLLYDYQNGLDPNPIQFLLSFTNDNVNSSVVHGTLFISGGVPSYMAVLVNDTNLTDAVWQPYNPTVTAILSTGDGSYNILVGLRGLPEDAQQTWLGAQLSLDTVPPVLVITNPATSTVGQRMIQLQGYANETLGGITFDVGNAAGIWTNQTGYLTGQYCDTNLFKFTTNWFQCYDIVLTNGLNIITLHATDLAGNTTTTNLSFTLDYSVVTNPPVLTVLWPQDGAQICGNNFTLKAKVDDPTASITVSITDSNGNTTVVSPNAERDGTIRAHDLPLAAGTNLITLTATNTAGFGSTTNLSAVQSAVAVTVDPLPTNELNQSLVSVTGTISDPDYALTVNGVLASINDDSTWEADDVPVNATGVADFDLEAYDTNSDLAGSLISEQVQPATVQLMSYSGSHLEDWSVLDSDSGNYSYYTGTMTNSVDWRYDTNGVLHYRATTTDPENPPVDEGTNSLPPDVNGSLPLWNGGPLNPPWEEAAVNVSVNGWFGLYYLTRGWQNHTKTHVMIAPQGEAESGTTEIYLVRACASELPYPSIANDFSWIGTDYGILMNRGRNLGYVGTWPLPPEWMHIQGHTLSNTGQTNEDGSYWGQTIAQGPAGVAVDVTPTIMSFHEYPDATFNVQAQAGHFSIIDANSGRDLTGQTNTVIVGQQMNLYAQFSLTNLSATSFHWTVPGYAISNFVFNANSGVVYTNFPTGNSNVVFYWVDGANNRTIQCSAMVLGQTITAQVTFNVLRPTAKISPWTTSVGVYGDNLEFIGITPTLPNGITFSNTITIPAGFSGTNLWIQVCSYRVRQLQDTNLAWHREIENGLNPYGDTPIPYAHFVGASPVDSPNMSLPENGYVHADATNAFEMWMMFQPLNGIPVPLRAVNWFWSGSATNVPFGGGAMVIWNLETGTNSIDPTDFDTLTFPTWNSDIQDRQWVPPLL